MIRNLQVYGTAGWQWMVEEPDGAVQFYRTNEDGYGLWRGRRQLRGVMEFELPRSRFKALDALEAFFDGAILD